MDTLCYPAIFTYDDGYDIAVTFPDLPGCTTCGKDEQEALEYAVKALYGHLLSMKENKEDFPVATPYDKVQHEKNECTVLISIDL